MAVGVAATTAVAVGLFTVSSNAGESRYRTVVAAQGDVEQTVTFDGTIAASNRSDLVFATDGTVLEVRTEVGDEVEAGDVLATLDATALEAAVTKAEADLAEAEAYLDDVEDGQIDTVKRANGGGTASAASASSTGTVTAAVYVVSAGTSTTTVAATSDGLTAKLAELTAQQEAVKNSQSEATSAIADAKSALAAQQEACEDESSADAVDEDATAGSGLSQECRDALQAVQAAQDVVAEKQDALQSALGVLGETLNAAVAQLKSDSDSGDATEPTPSPDSGTGTDGTTEGKNEKQTERSAPEQSERDAPSGGGQSGQVPGGSGSSGTTATAADLASAQADASDTVKRPLDQRRPMSIRRSPRWPRPRPTWPPRR